MFQDNNFTNGSSTNLMRSGIMEDKGWTNEVLIHKKGKKTNFYIPCYMRTKLKNIVSLDRQTMKGVVNVVIIFSVYYSELDESYPQVFQQLKQNIVLKFKIDPAVQLKEGFSTYKNQNDEDANNYITTKIDQKQKLITFSLRRMLLVPLNCQIFWSPFQFIEYVSSIQIGSINMKEHGIKLHFNLMNINEGFDKFQVVSYTEEGALGEFDLAQNLIKVEFTNQRFFSDDNSARSQIKDKIYQKYRNRIHYKESSNRSRKHSQDKYIDEESQLIEVNNVKCFQFAHFVYPVYRRALVPLFNLFFPMILLGFLNLGIFLQDNTRPGKKMLNISALIVSYIAFLPNIRQKIPPSNKLVISQILLFSMAALTLLCQAQTIQTRMNPDRWYLDEYKWQEDGLFIATLVLTLLIIFILILISLIHALYIYPYYNIQVSKDDNIKFDRKNWSNKLCDQYFNGLKLNSYNVKRLKQHLQLSGLSQKKQAKIQNQVLTHDLQDAKDKYITSNGVPDCPNLCI